MNPEDICQWRWDHGLTQQQMADLLLVTVLTVKRWEYGSNQAPWYLRLALERLDQLLAAQAEPVVT